MGSARSPLRAGIEIGPVGSTARHYHCLVDHVEIGRECLGARLCIGPQKRIGNRVVDTALAAVFTNEVLVVLLEFAAHSHTAGTESGPVLSRPTPTYRAHLEPSFSADEETSVVPAEIYLPHAIEIGIEVAWGKGVCGRDADDIDSSIIVVSRCDVSLVLGELNCGDDLPHGHIEDGLKSGEVPNHYLFRVTCSYQHGAIWRDVDFIDSLTSLLEEVRLFAPRSHK